MQHYCKPYDILHIHLNPLTNTVTETSYKDRYSHRREKSSTLTAWPQVRTGLAEVYPNTDSCTSDSGSVFQDYADTKNAHTEGMFARRSCQTYAGY